MVANTTRARMTRALLLATLGCSLAVLPAADAGTQKRVTKKKPVPHKKPARTKHHGSAHAKTTTPPRPIGASPEEQIVAMTNQARVSSGLAPLAVDERLTEAAQIHAEAMASLDEMAHDLPGVPLPTLADRLNYVGYPYGWAGENIGSFAVSAEAVETLWLGSPPHRQNMLLPYYTVTGVGVAYNHMGQPYYSQVFASPR